MSAGQKLRDALLLEKPLQVVGCINAYVAMMAKKAGYRALYLSGAGVANSCFGLPDLGLTSLDNVLEEVRRICSAVDLPLLVDADTGWGAELMIARTVRQMIAAGAAGIHIEDQVFDKRCGHRPNKRIVDITEMVARISAAVDAKSDPAFVVMARTDAVAVEGLDKALTRAVQLEQAGADMLFPEALTTLEEYKAFRSAVSIPILANITEFGQTPLFTTEELKSAGVDIVLYPLSAARAMYRAAEHVLHEIRSKGTQKDAIDTMQTRDELYQYLDYLKHEERVNHGRDNR
ncbi:MAG: methylisocitrate lyase [Chlamydiales bacterium]|nr:methylisocitrate lyase [Chlamydiales bacterium]